MSVIVILILKSPFELHVVILIVTVSLLQLNKRNTNPGNLPDKVVSPRGNEVERSGLLQKICFFEYSLAPQGPLWNLHP